MLREMREGVSQLPEDFDNVLLALLLVEDTSVGDALFALHVRGGVLIFCNWTPQYIAFVQDDKVPSMHHKKF